MESGEKKVKTKMTGGETSQLGAYPCDLFGQWDINRYDATGAWQALVWLNLTSYISATTLRRHTPAAHSFQEDERHMEQSCPGQLSLDQLTQKSESEPN